MDFANSPERQSFIDSLDRYLLNHYPSAARRRVDANYSRETWQALAELGVIGALFDPAVGGYGGSPYDIGAVFQSLGKGLVVEPFLPTLMVGRMLARAGGKNDLIADAVAGKRVFAFAQEEPQSRYDLSWVETAASRDASSWRLNGHKSVVAGAQAADYLLIPARTAGQPGDAAGISLFLLPRDTVGLRIRGYELIDGGRGGEVMLSDAAVTADMLIGAEHEGHGLIAEAVAAGIVALCWEALGLMDVLRAATLEYLRTRQQFGVPIGKFQALQHRMTNVALEIEQARSAAILAAAALDGDAQARDRAASAAKFTIDRVGTLVAEEAIQMHGGIGMTWELPLSHYAKRLVMIGHQLGDEDHHLARYMALAKQ